MKRFPFMQAEMTILFAIYELIAFVLCHDSGYTMVFWLFLGFGQSWKWEISFSVQLLLPEFTGCLRFPATRHVRQ